MTQTYDNIADLKETLLLYKSRFNVYVHDQNGNEYKIETIYHYEEEETLEDKVIIKIEINFC